MIKAGLRGVKEWTVIPFHPDAIFEITDCDFKFGACTGPIGDGRIFLELTSLGILALLRQEQNVYRRGYFIFCPAGEQ
jgi:hypothetical protein